MSVTVPTVDLQATLEFVGLYADQTEDVIMARWEDWANDGLDPIADADVWTDTREGTHWRMMAMLGVREAARLYDLAGTEVIMSGMVVWAWGVYLDDLAAVFNVARLPATQASGVETFAGPSGAFIEAGTTVSTVPASPEDDAVTFSTLDDATIPGGGSIDVAILADDPGAAGNVAAGAIVAVSTPLPAGVTMTNAATTGGGKDVETDDALRGRVLQATTGEGPGNVADLVRWARAYPGVGSAKAVPVWNGPNSALLIIGDEEGQPIPSSVVDGLQAELDPTAGRGDGIAPVGMQLTVDTPTPLTANFSATVTYATGYSASGAGGTQAVKPDVSDEMIAYLLTIVPGGVVSLAHMAGIVATHPGVVDVTLAKINGVAANLSVPIGPPPEVPELGSVAI